MGWRQAMYGEGAPEPEPKASRERRLDPAETLGYWMAGLAPCIGLLVGAALIARGPDNRGASVVAWSVVGLIAWAVVAGVLVAVLW